MTKKMTTEAGRKRRGFASPGEGQTCSAPPLPAPPPLWFRELPRQDEDQGRVRSEAGPARPDTGSAPEPTIRYLFLRKITSY